MKIYNPPALVKYSFLSQAKIWQILHCALGQRGRQSQTWNNSKNTQIRRLRADSCDSAKAFQKLFPS